LMSQTLYARKFMALSDGRKGATPITPKTNDTSPSPQQDPKKGQI